MTRYGRLLAVLVLAFVAFNPEVLAQSGQGGGGGGGSGWACEDYNHERCSWQCESPWVSSEDLCEDSDNPLPEGCHWNAGCGFSIRCLTMLADEVICEAHDEH